MPKKDAAAKEVPVAKTTEELMLNFGKGKYTAIPMAALWAKEIKRREENRHLTPAEILDLALREVLSGKVDWKDLKKIASSGGSAEPEKKAE